MTKGTKKEKKGRKKQAAEEKVQETIQVPSEAEDDDDPVETDADLVETDEIEEDVMMQVAKRRGGMKKAKVREELDKVDNAKPRAPSEDMSLLSRISKGRKAKQAKMGIMFIQVAHLNAASDPKAAEVDRKGVEGKEQRQRRVELRFGKWNKRPIDPKHSKDIADELIRGYNTSRTSPILIAVSEGDVLNPEEFLTERQLAETTSFPVVEWREDVAEVRVLTGQHRVDAARRALKTHVRPFSVAISDAAMTKKSQDAAQARYDRAVKAHKSDDMKKLKDELAAAKKVAANAQETLDDLRVAVDELRYWPAVFYSKERLTEHGDQASAVGKEELFRFLSENQKEKVRVKTTDEEIQDGLWAIREADGDEKKIKQLLSTYANAKQDVRAILSDEYVRPTMLNLLTISPTLLTSPILSSKFYASTRRIPGMERLQGRAPATTMILELVNGGMSIMQAILGPWLVDESTFEEFADLFAAYETPPDDMEEVELRSLQNSRRQSLRNIFNSVRRQSSHLTISAHNEACKTDPQLERIDTIEELEILTEEMWKGLDQVFVRTFKENLPKKMGIRDDDGWETMTRYRKRVRNYLKEYARKRLAGIEPSQYQEIHHRLHRAPTIADVALSDIFSPARLPLPTDTMVATLPILLEPVSMGLVEYARWVDGLADFMVFHSKASGKNKDKDGSAQTVAAVNPDNASGVISLALVKYLDGSAERIRYDLSEFFLELFNQRDEGLALLSSFTLHSSALRDIPGKHAAHQEEFSELTKTWTELAKKSKQFRSSKVLRKTVERNRDHDPITLMSRMMLMTSLARPRATNSDSRTVTNLGPFIAAEVHATVQNERQGWLRYRPVQALRALFINTIHRNNLITAATDEEKKQAEILYTFWDSLRSPENTVEIDVGMFIKQTDARNQWIRDNARVQAVATRLHSDFANNPSARVKLRVLSTTMAGHIFTLLTELGGVLDARRQHKFWPEVTFEDSDFNDPLYHTMRCIVPQPRVTPQPFSQQEILTGALSHDASDLDSEDSPEDPPEDDLEQDHGGREASIPRIVVKARLDARRPQAAGPSKKSRGKRRISEADSLPASQKKPRLHVEDGSIQVDVHEYLQGSLAPLASSSSVSRSEAAATTPIPHAFETPDPLSIAIKHASPRARPPSSISAGAPAVTSPFISRQDARRASPALSKGVSINEPESSSGPMQEETSVPPQSQSPRLALPNQPPPKLSADHSAFSDSPPEKSPPAERTDVEMRVPSPSASDPPSKLRIPPAVQGMITSHVEPRERSSSTSSDDSSAVAQALGISATKPLDPATIPKTLRSADVGDTPEEDEMEVEM